MIVDRRSVGFSAGHQPLLEEQLRGKIFGNCAVKALDVPLERVVADMLARVQVKCMFDGVEPSDGLGRMARQAEEANASEFLMSSTKAGDRVNVVGYYGGEHIFLSQNNLILVRGDWLGFVRYKKTGYFDPATVAAALDKVRGGGKVGWGELAGSGFPATYSDACRMRDDPKDKPVVFLEYATVLPQLRGMGLANRLLTETFSGLRQEGVEFAVAYARLPMLQREAYSATKAKDMLDEYVARKDGKGLSPDWGVRFHQQAGGVLVCGIPDCAVDDQRSRGQGALILYDLKTVQGR